jgi:hypothetical protein
MAVFVFGLAPDYLRFEPEMTCYHLTISVASRPENRTSGTRRAEPPVFGVGMGKSVMGAVICCNQHPRRGDSKAVPLEPRFMGGCTAAQGLPPLRIPAQRIASLGTLPSKGVPPLIPPLLAALPFVRVWKKTGKRGAVEPT